MMDTLELADKIERADAGNRILDVFVYRHCVDSNADLATVRALAPSYTTNVSAAEAFGQWVMRCAGHVLYEVHIRYVNDSRGGYCQAEITVPSREFYGRCLGQDVEARARMAAALRAIVQLGVGMARVA